MDRQSFIDTYGAVYEHSPWIAGDVYDRAGGDLPEGPEALHRSFSAVVMEAGQERQLALLRAHPPLGVGRAGEAALTDASRSEQSGAGLDRCSPEEFEAFEKLNAGYEEKFGFPFIIAVRGRSRQEILGVFRHRLHNSRAREFQEALRQVLRIGQLRLEAIADA